ncbi:MAG: 50S ribosomal protein L5 [Phycisphaerae bacterium]
MADETANSNGNATATKPRAPRLIAHYREQIAPQLSQRFGYKNALAIPRLEKIVVSMGVGKPVTAGNKQHIEHAERDLSLIVGQKPVRCRAKKSVAQFKVREGQETGLKVTLRGVRMYEFLDRVITLAIPRVKDFRGLSPKGFDKFGNYNFGFAEQSVFPEIDPAGITSPQGMNITIVSTARNADEGRALLDGFGFPFRDDTKK